MRSSRFDGKVAIVTGGASGIGAALVEILVAEGAKVMVADIDDVAAQALRDTLGVAYRHTNVADADDAAAMVEHTAAEFGRIDILVNNAGIGTFGKTPDVAVATWDKVVGVNLNAIFYACRAAIPIMRRHGGAIVNTASISGLAADYGFTAYNATKAAVINYSRALAIDHAAEGIRVNVVCPGFVAHTNLTKAASVTPEALEIWTSAIPMQRAGTAKEVANAMAFLLSDEASYITGAMLIADGGMTAHTGQPNMVKHYSDLADR